jgi:hypothetical protein
MIILPYTSSTFFAISQPASTSRWVLLQKFDSPMKKLFITESKSIIELRNRYFDFVAPASAARQASLSMMAAIKLIPLL